MTFGFNDNVVWPCLWHRLALITTPLGLDFYIAYFQWFCRIE